MSGNCVHVRMFFNMTHTHTDCFWLLDVLLKYAVSGPSQYPFSSVKRYRPPPPTLPSRIEGVPLPPPHTHTHTTQVYVMYICIGQCLDVCNKLFCIYPGIHFANCSFLGFFWVSFRQQAAPLLSCAGQGKPPEHQTHPLLPPAGLGHATPPKLFSPP